MEYFPLGTIHSLGFLPSWFSHTHALSHVELGPWGSSPDGCSPRSSSDLSGARRHLTQTSLSNSVSCYLLALYLVSSSSCLLDSSACVSHRRLNHSLHPVFIARFYHSVNCSSPKPKPPPFSHFTSRFTFPSSACAAFSVQATDTLGLKNIRLLSVRIKSALLTMALKALYDPSRPRLTPLSPYLTLQLTALLAAPGACTKPCSASGPLHFLLVLLCLFDSFSAFNSQLKSYLVR